MCALIFPVRTALPNCPQPWHGSQWTDLGSDPVWLCFSQPSPSGRVCIISPEPLANRISILDMCSGVPG